MASNIGSKSSAFHYMLIGRNVFLRNGILYEPRQIQTPLTFHKETRKATKIKKIGKEVRRNRRVRSTSQRAAWRKDHEVSSQSFHYVLVFYEFP